MEFSLLKRTKTPWGIRTAYCRCVVPYIVEKDGESIKKQKYSEKEKEIDVGGVWNLTDDITVFKVNTSPNFLLKFIKGGWDLPDCNVIIYTDIMCPKCRSYFRVYKNKETLDRWKRLILETRLDMSVHGISKYRIRDKKEWNSDNN